MLAGLTAVLLHASSAVAATIPVTTTDATSAVACTLRDAITAANADAASGACPAGAGDDVVDLTGLTGEITTGGSGLPDLATNMHVRGPGAALLTIDGAEGNRVFSVTGGTVPARNVCAAIPSATQFGNGSGVDNPQAFVVSADGRTLYTASGNDAAVARFVLAPEPITTTTTTITATTSTTSTTLPAQPIRGKALLIVDPAARKRRIVFAARDSRLDTSAGSGIDPVVDGAVLQVFNDAGTFDSACFDLPAAGWTAKGKPAKRTFRYKDKRLARGPCRAVTVEDGKLLEAICLGKAQPIAYSLDEPAQERVAVRFRSGATEYCAVFGGKIVKDVQNRKFTAKKAPAPAACPAPPAGCP